MKKNGKGGWVLLPEEMVWMQISKLRLLTALLLWQPFRLMESDLNHDMDTFFIKLILTQNLDFITIVRLQ